jgi:hypothetical protein
MSIKLRCPFCRSAFTMEDAADGRKTACPVCKQNLVLSKTSAPPINPVPPTNVGAKGAESAIPCAIPVAKVITAPQGVVPPAALPVLGSPPPRSDRRHAGDDIERSPRQGQRFPNDSSHQMYVVVGGIIFALLCVLIGVRFLLFMMQWEKDHPPPPARILPRMEGKWADVADRIEIGGEQGIDNIGYTKFEMVNEGKPLSGVLKYQGDSTGIHWMKTIKPKEEDKWFFRFDKTVGELKHDPWKDTLTVTVDGKTQVFHRIQ